MLWLLLGWLACSGGGMGGPGGEGEPAAAVDPRTLVEAAPVGRGDVALRIAASAAVESESQASLIAEASGVVTALNVEEGDAVRAGQVLASLAAPSLDAGLSRARAEAARAEAELATTERLFAAGAASKAEVEAAQRALSLARTSQTEASRTQGATAIRSPIAGTVVTRNLKKGEVAPMGQPAFVVADLSRLQVVIHLPERELSRVRVGQPVRVESAYDASVVGEGSVARISPVIDATTGTFKVTISLSSATQFRPGQFVNLGIEVDRHTAALVVPRRALVWEEDRAYVMKVVEGPPPKKEGEEKKEGEGEAKKEGEEAKGEGEEKAPEVPGPYRRAVKTLVKVGFEEGEQAEILEGLLEGEQVVVVGNQSLRDDTRLRLPGDPEMPKPTPEGAEGEEKAEGEKKAEGQ